ncbi:MAG: NrdH-redoxin [Anaerolineae bacterium]|nr:MAG: NrdH-redoxin [Anaerolineae bacterium]
MSEADLYNRQPSKIVMYSASWCPDCRRAKAFFETRGVEYLDVDIGRDSEAYRFIEKTTRRVRIPTIFFPDGTMLIEPSNEMLTAKLENRL